MKKMGLGLILFVVLAFAADQAFDWLKLKAPAGTTETGIKINRESSQQWKMSLNTDSLVFADSNGTEILALRQGVAFLPGGGASTYLTSPDGSPDTALKITNDGIIEIPTDNLSWQMNTHKIAQSYIGYYSVFQLCNIDPYGDTTAHLYLDSWRNNCFMGNNAGGLYNTYTIKSEGYYNIGIGAGALYSDTNNIYDRDDNVAIGSYTLNSLIIGHDNTAIGDEALDYLTYGENNTAIGSTAMWYMDTVSFTVAIGYSAGDCRYTKSPCAVSKGENVFIGAEAGFGFTNRYNIVVGNWNGVSNKTSGRGDSNLVVIGNNSLADNDTCSESVFIGNKVAESSAKATNAVIVGNSAGKYARAGDVYIGFSAGIWEKNTNKLFIDNRPRADSASARAQALIYGVFADSTYDQSLALNANVTVSDSLLLPNKGLRVAKNITASSYAAIGASAPAIAFKKLTGTTAQTVVDTTIAHGLNQNKIMGVQVTIDEGTNQHTFEGACYANGTASAYAYFDTTNIHVTLTDAALENKPFRVLVTYEE